MRYRIEYTKRADKNYQKLDRTLRKRIDEGLKELCKYYDKKTNKKPDIKALKGKYKGFYRLRVGEYRVIFSVKSKEIVILVINVLPRGNAYK